MTGRIVPSGRAWGIAASRPTACALVGFLTSLSVLSIAGCGERTVADIRAAGQRSATESLQRVTVGRPERRTVEVATEQPGRIEAFETTPLYPKLAGYVEEFAADIGDSVQQGQVLLRLWVPELDDELQQKQALLDQAEAQVTQAEAAQRAAEAGVKTAAARVNQSRAGVTRARGEFDRWQAEHRRIDELARGGSISQKLVDEALNQFRAAEAARQEAEANVESAAAALEEARAKLVQAQADQEVAVAHRRVADANLAYARTEAAYRDIKAPYDGVLTQRNVNTGDYAEPGRGRDATPLLVIVRTDRVRIFVDVPETEAPLVDRGDAATVRVQALGGRAFEGTVARTSWALSDSNHSLRVEVDLANGEGVLRPGMYAVAGILLARHENVLTLPTTALAYEDAAPFVCRVESDTIYRIPVDIGLKGSGYAEVLAGITGDESIVLNRPELLKEGQPVAVARAEK